MSPTPSLVDIHCHLLPGLDDGARTWEESLAMARMAAADGISHVIATPHQLGSYESNHGEVIRHRVNMLQQTLDEQGIPVHVHPGADVRIDASLIEHIDSGMVVTLADRRRHVLLELPHELYLPLDRIMVSLAERNIVGILSHPERNQGLQCERKHIASLVERGCLTQITAGSLMGTFGPRCQELACWMLDEGLVHFIATDAHGVRSRRPLLRRAYELACQRVGEDTAADLCCGHPQAVLEGRSVPAGRGRRRRRRTAWFSWRKAS